MRSRRRSDRRGRHRCRAARGALDDLFRDHDLLDAFEARQVEHGVEQDTFHDRAQAARAGLKSAVPPDGASMNYTVYCSKQR
jgi:hypothetical protein